MTAMHEKELAVVT